MNSTTKNKTGLVSLSFTMLLVSLGLFACSSISPQGSQTLNQNTSSALQAQCVKSSIYKNPSISGHVIESPKYMLVTIINGEDTVKNEGELCIINKKTKQLEVTKISELDFLKSAYTTTTMEK